VIFTAEPLMRLACTIHNVDAPLTVKSFFMGAVVIPATVFAIQAALLALALELLKPRRA
jgi:hypothetical protein